MSNITFCGYTQEEIKGMADEIERLRKALQEARDALRNDFEPDNQSRAWHRANRALLQNPRELTPEAENPNDFN